MSFLSESVWWWWQQAIGPLVIVVITKHRSNIDILLNINIKRLPIDWWTAAAPKNPFPIRLYINHHISTHSGNVDSFTGDMSNLLVETGDHSYCLMFVLCLLRCHFEGIFVGTPDI